MTEAELAEDCMWDAAVPRLANINAKLYSWFLKEMPPRPAPID